MAKKRRFIVASRRMVIAGKVVEQGDVVSLDYDDPTVRGWSRAGNIRLLTHIIEHRTPLTDFGFYFASFFLQCSSIFT